MLEALQGDELGVAPLGGCADQGNNDRRLQGAQLIGLLGEDFETSIRMYQALSLRQDALRALPADVGSGVGLAKAFGRLSQLLEVWKL